MKKVWALLLAVLMCLTFAACGEAEQPPVGGSIQYPQYVPGGTAQEVLPGTDKAPTEQRPDASREDLKTDAPAIKDEALVESYVAANQAELVESFEQAVSASGLGYNTTVKAVGTGIVVDMYMDSMNNMPDNFSETLQATYDSLQSIWDIMLAAMQEDLPELTYFTFNVCDGNGRQMAVVHAGNK